MTNTLTYAGFIGFVIAMLVVDLKLFHTRPGKSPTKQAATWVAVWVALAVAFGVLLFFWRGPTRTAEYFTGYLIEYSLSVDNMFVFIVIFSYFRVPPDYQHQVLFLGILGAIVFRGAFIAGGIALIERFDWTIYVLGALLLITAIRIIRGVEDVDPDKNPIIRLFSRRFRVSKAFDGQKLFTRIDGKRVATPLFVVLLMIETTDIVFAADSIPAIFAITEDPFVILTSNVFAILGLRSLYFLLAGSMARFHLLKYGLGVILAFVGVKMLLSEVVHIPIWLSLTVVVGVLGVAVVTSLLSPPRSVSLDVPPPPADPLEGLERPPREQSSQAASPRAGRTEQPPPR